MFNFYYVDNLDLFIYCGFEFIFFSFLEDIEFLLAIDGVYFGGGFFEFFVE